MIVALLTNSGRGHGAFDIQNLHAPAGQFFSDHGALDIHEANVAKNSGDGQTFMAVPTQYLQIAAASLSDIEAVRIATESRLRSWDDVGPGHVPERVVIKAQLDALIAIEKQAIKDVERALSKHPLGVFVKSGQAKGIGKKQGGRLIAAIGDPYIKAAIVDRDGNVIERARPRRGPAELWAYCGLHVIDGQRPRRQKGVKANWSQEAKTRAVLVAGSVIKHPGSHYEQVYRRAREVAANKTHTHQCQNRVRPPGSPNGCGTQANPEWGAPGSPWRPGHVNQHAISVTAKEILKDLYLAARDLHQS